VKKYEGKIVGILGTVIIHLLAGIIFMSFKLHTIKKAQTREFEIEFVAMEEPQEEDRKIELPPTTVENVLHDDAEMLNIARNLANKSEEKINPSDYIDKVKEELIKSGKLGTDNFIDEQKAKQEQPEKDPLSVEGKANDNDEEEKPRESQEMAANYKGPTRIFYDLSGRTHTYLPIPIYKCQGSGKVVLLIEVDEKGFVKNASVIVNESTALDECLLETAVKTALISRFSADLNAPKLQKGTLTYIFVAQ
jgi:outer membrane biosynthesis protein TonB